MNTPHDFPVAARQAGYLPFIHFNNDELIEALFVAADAARSLRALHQLLMGYHADAELRPQDVAALLDAIYQRLANELQLDDTEVLL
jgi:hypothetical protein